MGEVCPKTTLYARCRNRAVALFTASLLASWTLCPAQAQPTLRPPVLSNDLVHAQLTLSNCTNTTILYTVQTSADLVNWTNIQSSFAAFTNVLITVPATNQQAFYQLVTTPAPIFQAAIITVSNVGFRGNGITVDSFDSSNPLYSTGGIYNASQRKANGNVYAGGSITNSITVQNANIYGKVMTGPGTTQSNVGLGSQGAVGDLAWQAANSKGIEPGYWSGGFNATIPDVVPPVGGSDLPEVVSNVITLTGGAYVTAVAPTNLIAVTASSTLWIQTSYTVYISLPASNVYLTLYVGTANGSGDSVSLGSKGSINYPGYASNLQIYGLPSVASISFLGNAGFAGTIYAPEAVISGGGSGNNTLDTSGAIIANSILANGHWNFHYDESLARYGPGF